MRTSIWIATGLFVLVAAWLASGIFISDSGDEEEIVQVEEPAPTLVEVRTSTAESVPQYIFAQGVAQPYRTTDVVVSTGGTLDAVEVQQGDIVEAGAELARVRLAALESQLRSARAQVESLEADLQAARQLAEQGFTTESRVRELESQLENARANLEDILEDIRDTTIEAPIAGIVSDVFVNSGETLSAGTAIARIVDNAPLRVELNISQRDVGRVDIGREAVVSFATEALAKGRVCFVAPAADPQTRTFRVEIRVPNEERTIPSVVSTEVRFQTGEADAHFISPAILALSDAGVLGAKSVGEDNVVHFHPVEIVRTEGDGIWVAGLPETLRFITVGQGFVREGERVRVREVESGQGEAAGGTLGNAPLPTATVETEAFEGATDLPAAPPADELCRGVGSNAVMTSSVPGSSGQGAPAPDGSPGQQPDGVGGGSQAPADGGGAPNAGAGTTQSVPDTASPEPTSPAIPSPRNEQSPPQASDETGTQQPDGGPGGAVDAPPAGGDQSGAGVAPPSEVEGVEP
ncbi:efflux RND transporter periplasmic adaptor subunit [Chelativorans sp. YIM 93263]|uniref:efflux RND transporter periplasmic adaptor subunit n=1 Tax=Chelativorans sp. YIM 93263 TaxID=2906648 RepID=UPI002378B753|nr:efflux RND transporter periplasmic adaptor subunit [Chelativorans sp. YIM 93263]